MGVDHNSEHDKKNKKDEMHNEFLSGHPIPDNYPIQIYIPVVSSMICIMHSYTALTTL